MIVSASRRTDIPAFYGQWFTTRLKAGFADVANPFNPKQVRRVDLRPEAVDTIIFWTRNARPILKRLKRLESDGYRYYFLYTITGYPKALEPNLPAVEAAIRCFKELSDRIGGPRTIWRYDPIVLSSLTDHDFHLRNFERLCRALNGSTERVIVSFLDSYKKTARRLKALSEAFGIEWYSAENGGEPLMGLMQVLGEISSAYGIRMQSCAEDLDLTPAGIAPGQCVDYDLINRLFGLTLPYRKDATQRKKCLCSTSVDIGAYNSCGYRCVYCYANASFDTARANLRAHCSGAAVLLPQRNPNEEA